MNENRTVRRSLASLRAPDRATLDRLRGVSDEQIERERASEADAPPSDEEFWTSAELVEPPKRKETISIRLDPEILKYFRAGGEGYQSRINAVLRSYVAAKGRRRA
jgi:uncharacterized protein (DUF4415 family)